MYFYNYSDIYEVIFFKCPTSMCVGLSAAGPGEPGALSPEEVHQGEGDGGRQARVRGPPPSRQPLLPQKVHIRMGLHRLVFERHLY